MNLRLEGLKAPSRELRPSKTRAKEKAEGAEARRVR